MPIRVSRKARAAPSLAAFFALMTYCAFSLGGPSLARAQQDKPPNEIPALTEQQLAQLVEAGQQLAHKKCASCHAISLKDESKNKDAPPFRDFADKWPLETLEESLAEGIVTGHSEMPEFILNPEQITAFIEFLATLQKK